MFNLLRDVWCAILLFDIIIHRTRSERQKANKFQNACREKCVLSDTMCVCGWCNEKIRQL